MLADPSGAHCAVRTFLMSSERNPAQATSAPRPTLGYVSLAALMPHAPVLVPSVGGEYLSQVEETCTALVEVGQRGAASHAGASRAAGSIMAPRCRFII